MMNSFYITLIKYNISRFSRWSSKLCRSRQVVRWANENFCCYSILAILQVPEEGSFQDRRLPWPLRNVTSKLKKNVQIHSGYIYLFRYWVWSSRGWGFPRFRRAPNIRAGRFLGLRLLGGGEGRGWGYLVGGLWGWGYSVGGGGVWGYLVEDEVGIGRW